jgi:hypothetical protein
MAMLRARVLCHRKNSRKILGDKIREPIYSSVLEGQSQKDRNVVFPIIFLAYMILEMIIRQMNHET